MIIVVIIISTIEFQTNLRSKGFESPVIINKIVILLKLDLYTS